MNIKPIMTAFLVMVLTMLVGCGKEKRAPVSGEYGQTLVNAIQLTPKQIQKINASTMPKPTKGKNVPDVGISFAADKEQNPYRFVMVAKGVALAAGEVNMRWMGGVQSGMNNGYKPEIFREEDGSKYKAGEPVLLVMASDPFSVASSSEHTEFGYQALARLTLRENIQLNSLELQIWQGKGGKFSWTRYLGLFALLLLVLASVNRLYRIATNR